MTWNSSINPHELPDTAKHLELDGIIMKEFIFRIEKMFIQAILQKIILQLTIKVYFILRSPINSW